MTRAAITILAFLIAHPSIYLLLNEAAVMFEITNREPNQELSWQMTLALASSDSSLSRLQL
ncbi:hypothetical protein [Pseudomonas syringae]|uniref:hypothetical protein n=1 Tax=Pseudomonas syringae TaxID=317 RepID=UPI0004222373|nr:hypothetical protein [Pseudomonas syringae]